MNSEEVQVKKKQQGVTAKHFNPHVKITPVKAFHFPNSARISPRHFLTKCSRYHVFITRRSSINSQQTCFNLLRVSASTSTASLCVRAALYSLHQSGLIVSDAAFRRSAAEFNSLLASLSFFEVG